MNNVIPFPARRSPGVPTHSHYRPQVTIDGEFIDDDMPPVLFDPDEDLCELNMYVRIAVDSLTE